jgi:hypothetical protein
MCFVGPYVLNRLVVASVELLQELLRFAQKGFYFGADVGVGVCVRVCLGVGVWCVLVCTLLE